MICQQRNRVSRDISIEESKSAVTEYILPSRPQESSQMYMFVVDTCCEEESDLIALKDTLMTAISQLSPNSEIGLITFGKHVYVHDLSSPDALSSVCFNGAKEYSEEEVKKSLGKGFSHTLEICEFQTSQVIESLLIDSFGRRQGQRVARASGSALKIASHVTNIAFGKRPARITFFSSGPCTYGPGIVVDRELREPIRSHHDIVNGTRSARHFQNARKFYQSLAEAISLAGHVTDFFIGSYDQVGLSEMSKMASYTGGAVVLSDAFSTAIFRQSVQRFFENLQETGSNGAIEVKTASFFKVKGLVGHALSLKKKANNVSSTSIGEGSTCAWKACSIGAQSTYAIFFENETKTSDSVNQPFLYLQFILHYHHASGDTRLRVTTVARPLLGPDQLNLLPTMFDQEAAAVIVARQALSLKDVDLIRWCDQLLVKLCSRFAEYTNGVPSSFQLSHQFSLFPQFMFHLRRSSLIQVFNNSPDETAFIRHVFLQEDCSNSLIIIQPTLTSFSLEEEEPEPVLLDSTSISPSTILLLDTFFHILLFHGSQIAEWKKAKYHELEEYKYLADFLAEPKKEAAELLFDRFPLPRFIDTEEGASQARFLYSKLNPTTNYKTDVAAAQNGAVILTDDVSLQSFMEYVQKRAVAAK